MHDRFKRKTLVCRADFTGALAKWLVKQSPYSVPDNLGTCIALFDKQLDELFSTQAPDQFVEIQLKDITNIVYAMLEKIPEVMQLNEPKNKGAQELVFVSRFSTPMPADDDFIDIMAVAQNITCEFADREDAQAYLDSMTAYKDYI